MGLTVDPETLKLVEGEAAEAAAGGPPPGSRPVVGALIAGYGCAVNPAHIVKIETAQAGNEFYVRAFLQATPTTTQVGGVGTTVQAGIALLTPPLATEQEANEACDAICSSFFLMLSANPNGGGIYWPPPKMPVDRPSVPVV